MSNNPFIEYHSPATSFANRYPDIGGLGGAPDPNQGQWQPSPASPGAYLGVQQQPSPFGAQPGYSSPFPQPSPLANQPTGWGGGGGYGAQGPMMPAPSSPVGGFQPGSAFGQQMQGQLTGYPGAAGVGMGYQQTGWGGPQQQQQQALPSILSQFDPYAQLGALQNAPPSSAPGHTRTLSAGGGGGQQGTGPGGYQHPREFVRTHKAELEAWDAYAWKQLLNAFDALKDAWQRRKQEAEAQARNLAAAAYYDYGAAQESERLQGVSAILLSSRSDDLT